MLFLQDTMFLWRRRTCGVSQKFWRRLRYSLSWWFNEEMWWHLEKFCLQNWSRYRLICVWLKNTLFYHKISLFFQILRFYIPFLNLFTPNLFFNCLVDCFHLIKLSICVASSLFPNVNHCRIFLVCKNVYISSLK